MRQTTVSSLGERALIARITSRLATPPWVAVGPGDDAAVIEPARGTLDVLTTDALVDGIHFDLRFTPADAVGHRALAVNLSDLAAMGAQPRAALLSLLLPDDLEVATLDGIVEGLLALADRYRVALVGGNITRTTGPLTLDVTAIGSVRPRRILTRGGARPGDEIYVTGTLGQAAVGLAVLRSGRSPVGTQTDCVERYLRPDPRVRTGMLLGRNRAATSCIDLSDGLADAVWQVAEASGVGITIDAMSLSLADELLGLVVGDVARTWDVTRTLVQPDAADVLRSVLHKVMTAGDDYELMFTSRPAQRGRLRSVRQQAGDLPITKIGVVTKGHDVLLRDAQGTRDMPRGYEHWPSA